MATSLVKEIEEQCRKQKGVVIINTLKPTEKREKLVATLTGEVKKVTARLKSLSLCGVNDSIKPIIYNSSFIFRRKEEAVAQIRIFSEIPPTIPPVENITYIIILFTLNHNQDTLNISNESYIISSYQWNDANLLEGQFRAFQLANLFKIIIDHSLVVESSSSSSSSSSHINVTPNSSYEELRRRGGSSSGGGSRQQQQKSLDCVVESVENMTISPSSSLNDNMIMDNSSNDNIVNNNIVSTTRASYYISFSDTPFADIMVEKSGGGTNKQTKHASNSRYAQLLLDTTFSRQFKGTTIDIYEEYITYLTRCPWYSHYRSVIGFLYDMIIHMKHDHTKMDKILEKVIETELFINMKSIDPKGGNTLMIYRFIYEIEEIRPIWFDHYRISPELNNQFWVQVADNHFRVKSDWLLKFPNLQNDNRRLPIINGFIDLDENDFCDIFLPTFYRCMMIDLYHYLVYIEAYYTKYTNEISIIESMERFIYTDDTRDFFSSFPLNNSLTDYYDFAVAFGCPTLTTEQVSIKLSTDEYYRELHRLRITESTASSLKSSLTKTTRSSSSSSSSPPKIIQSSSSSSLSSSTYQHALQEFDRSTMPDLEDLLNPDANYLPKCLANLMNENGERRRKMKYADRLHVTTYLADMKYERDEIMEAFPDDANAIEANYKTYKRKREKDGDKKFSTLYCTAIMNKSENNNDDDNDHCQCPYTSSVGMIVVDNEDKAITYKKYRNSCYSNIIPSGSFSHPLNYVSIQVNK